MKFTVDVRDLERSIAQLTSGRIGSRKQYIVKACDGLCISVSDGDVTAMTRVHADVAETGYATVNAGRLFTVVKSAPDGNMTFSLDGDCLTVKAGSLAVRIDVESCNAIDAPEFTGVAAGGLTMPLKAFRAITRKVVRTAAKDKYASARFGGILVSGGHGAVQMVSTDGCRLSKVVGRASRGELDGTTVPAELLTKAVSLLKGREVTIHASGGAASIRSGDVEVVARVSSLSFPPWEHIVPVSCDFAVSADTAILAMAVASVLPCASAKSGITLAFDTFSMRVLAESDAGESSSTVASELVDGRVSVNNYMLMINARYLADALRSVDSGTVELRSSGPGAPLLILDAANPEDIHMVMPMLPARKLPA